MSYRLAFAADSKGGWDQLSVDAQEWVLDQLEAFAAALKPFPGMMDTDLRLLYEAADFRQDITLTLLVTGTTQTITLTDVQPGRHRRRRW